MYFQGPHVEAFTGGFDSSHGCSVATLDRSNKGCRRATNDRRRHRARVRSRSRTPPWLPAPVFLTPGPPADCFAALGQRSPPRRTASPPQTSNDCSGPRRAPKDYSSDHTRDATRSSSPSLMMLVLLATIGVLAYATFIFRPSHHGDLLPFALVVTAETWLIAQALLALWTILSSGYDARDFSYHQAKRGLFDPGRILAHGLEETTLASGRCRSTRSRSPSTCSSPPTGRTSTSIRNTVAAALAIRGAHRTLVLDDGRSDDVRDLAAQLGAEYVRRPDNQGAKAGNINHALLDHRRRVLRRLRRRLRTRRRSSSTRRCPSSPTDKVAFVQTPQTYGNLHTLHLPRLRLHAVGVLLASSSRARTASTRRSAWGRTSIFRRNAIDRHRRDLPAVEVRGHLDLDLTCTSAVGAPSTSRRGAGGR